MKHVLLIAWRSLISRPGRAIASILGVAVGLSTVLAVATVDHNTILTEQLRRGERIGYPDIVVRPVRPNPEEMFSIPSILEQDPDVLTATPMFRNRGVISKLESGTPPRPVTVCGMSPGAGPHFGAYDVIEGEDLVHAEGQAVLISVGVAQSTGLGIGDRVAVEAVAPKVSVCIEGERVVEEKGKLGEGARIEVTVRGIIGAQNLGRTPVVILPFERAARMYEGMYFVPEYWGELAPRAIYQDVRARMKDHFIVEKPRRALVGERVDQRAFRKGIRISAFLSLFLGLYVIYNAFSMSLVERIRDIGLLRAMGMTTREVKGAFLVEGALVAVGGVVVGLGLSALIVYVMKSLGITTLGHGKPLEINEVPWNYVTIVCGIGFVVAILGVVAPLLRAGRLSVIEAIRTGQSAFSERPLRALQSLCFVLLIAILPVAYFIITPPLGEKQSVILTMVITAAVTLAVFIGVINVFPKVARRAVVLLMAPWKRVFSIETWLAQSAASQAQQRIRASVTGLMLVFAGILVINSVILSLKDETERFADVAIDGRVFVRLKEGKAESLGPVLSLDGVQDVYSLSAGIASPFPLFGLATQHLQTSGGDLLADSSVREAFDRGEGIILSTFLAKSFDYEVGDIVDLPTFKGKKSVTIVAIDDRLGFFPDDRNYALMEMASFEHAFCVGNKVGNDYVATIASGHDSGDVRTRIEEALAGVPLQYVRSDRTIRELYTRDRDLDFLIFDVILLLTAILAAVGMLNSLTIAVLERRREISLLHAVGLGRREIGTLITLEAGTMGLLGGGLALLLGGIMSSLAIRGLAIVSELDVRWELTPWTVAVPVVGALVVSLSACLIPVYRSRQFERCDWE